MSALADEPAKPAAAKAAAEEPAKKSAEPQPAATRRRQKPGRAEAGRGVTGQTALAKAAPLGGGKKEALPARKPPRRLSRILIPAGRRRN